MHYKVVWKLKLCQSLINESLNIVDFLICLDLYEHVHEGEYKDNLLINSF